MSVVSVADLLREPPEAERWLVDGIVPCGALTLVSAAPKVGKSTAMRCLSVAVARGWPWLGRRTVQGPVLYLCLEDKRSEVRRHYAAMGAQPSDPIYLYIDRLAPDHAMEHVSTCIEDLKPSLVIVDPLFRFLRVADVSDYAQVCRAFDPLIDVARHSRAAIVLTHHQRKSGGPDGNETLGSQAIFGSVDNTIFLYRQDQHREMRTQVRIGEDIPRTAITLDEDGWVSLGGSCARSIDVQILQALKNSHPSEMSLCEVRTAMGRRAEDVNRALEQLVQRRLVERTGGGHKGSAYRFRFLAPGDTQSCLEEANDTIVANHSD